MWVHVCWSYIYIFLSTSLHTTKCYKKIIKTYVIIIIQRNHIYNVYSKLQNIIQNIRFISLLIPSWWGMKLCLRLIFFLPYNIKLHGSAISTGEEMLRYPVILERGPVRSRGSPTPGDAAVFLTRYFPDRHQECRVKSLICYKGQLKP